MRPLSWVILAVAMAGFLAVGSAQAKITDSPHGIPGGAYWNKSGEICAVCHTPHSATSAALPLWNHTMTTATFTLYSSPSMNASVGQPSTASKACLSCHDGTIAMDAYGGRPGTPLFKLPAGIPAHLGTDLSGDHPISITYNSALAAADGGLHDPAAKTVPDLGNKTIQEGMLINGKVECSSCHDVHKSKGYSPSSYKLLLVNNDASGLCLTCHNK